MSIESFFEGLWSKATALATAAEPIVQELAPAAQAVGSVASALVPSIAPEIAAVTALAPSAISDVASVVAAGKSAATAMGPAITDLETAITNLFHITPTPTGVVLTAKTTTATVPAS